jgi:hypothetical protein
LHDPYGVPAQGTVVARSGTHHQQPGRPSGLGKDRRDRTLDRRCADLKIRMIGPNRRLCRGQEGITVGTSTELGRVRVGEVPIQPWNRMHQSQRKPVPGGEIRGPPGCADSAVGSVDPGDDVRLVGCGAVVHRISVGAIGLRVQKHCSGANVQFAKPICLPAFDARHEGT